MMKVYPQPLEIGDEEGFVPEKDLFGRKQLASGMSHLVETVEDPLVIAFDGPWGSGKTTFLKMWAGELRKNGHPVIFFDAFENDYVEDSFAAMAREIIELAENAKLPDIKTIETIRTSAARLGALLLKSSAKIGLKVAVRAATAGLAGPDDFKSAAKDIEKEAESAADAYMSQLLDKPRKQKEIIRQFREALEALPSLLSPPKGEERQRPLIFIIDELDRCKPLFALSLLERVKHFMAVPNVHFVLGVHMRQLESSVRYAYGRDIDAAAYLQKFVNLTIFNTEIDADGLATDLHKYAEYLARVLAIREDSDSPLDPSVETIIRLIRYEKMSYRTLERAFTILALAIGLTPPARLQLGAIMGGLTMMKLLRADLFVKAKQGTLTFGEAEAFLRFEQSTDGEGNSWEKNWWICCLVEPVPANLDGFVTSLHQYGFRNMRAVLKYTANKIIDRLDRN
jgi:hypothetical protein